MIKLLDFHKESRKIYGGSMNRIFYYIVMIGCGGNGGYAVQRITKMLYAFEHVKSFLMLADPDTVEEKNLLRQPFIHSDIGKKKADILAKRYGATYGLKIGSSSDGYIESVEQLEALFSHTDYMHASGQVIQNVLIGAVDNDYSRNIMNDFFNKRDDLIYIDAGIEGVMLPGGGAKPEEEWTEEENREHRESGYSGQIVVGVKKNGHVVLPPLNDVYPIDAKDAIPPSHSCGVVPYQPQRMIANEMAAFQITAVMNELFATNSVLVHVLNFNARMAACRPVFAEDVAVYPASFNSDPDTSEDDDEQDEGNELQDQE
ncbi:dinucleotide-utilizing protein (plasmid) [Paenibacillus rhizovicinus]|uniref:Dinucleotide-utilizing protein n=1 Tax=Paenibacillus rhizovicinus TaxID=2704463 RepID=A0A6C0PAH2_9BACL|nr:ThiF family adenylyltransferase [Paenibacillus rhizovicinus]QHW35574.1 dinucleotide-utilizing protein [Paenibacillus rhizovicinus]